MDPLRPTLEQRRVDCCIAGGGPAGMMLGLLLARAGRRVLVAEKHADFLRDFRGDTIHPSTLEVIRELGLLEEFLRRPHQEVRELRGEFGNQRVTLADFSHLPAHCQFVALMPQWEFLDFLLAHARQYPGFQLEMQAEVTDLIRERDVVTGVRMRTPAGSLDVSAHLTIGADGRKSLVRARAGLRVLDQGSPIDVLWMKISRREQDPDLPFGRIDRGRVLVLIYRDSYWQCGLVIPKGAGAELQREGIEAVRREVAASAPFLQDRVAELTSWDQIGLLTVTIDRLEKWSLPGLLCIGDAAHAMSPVGGVGINLAIQDAVAAANQLAEPLSRGVVPPEVLARIQARRELPTRLTQAVQVFLQNRILSPALHAGNGHSATWPAELFRRWPVLRRVPARLFGMGFLPEHVRLPAGHTP
jgi:2-polyprenyl-6-methoxyphenol hydroxylase-like FAD-dependent oxidoreductase